jgi:hypothetical protein
MSSVLFDVDPPKIGSVSLAPPVRDCTRDANPTDRFALPVSSGITSFEAVVTVGCDADHLQPATLNLMLRQKRQVIRNMFHNILLRRILDFEIDGSGKKVSGFSMLLDFSISFSYTLASQAPILTNTKYSIL